MIKNVLIVDDDDEDIELFCEAVKEISQDISCNSAGNGKEALQFLLRQGAILPDCIFLDINMPKMGGKQCLVELKKYNQIKNISVVMYSTSKLASDVEETSKLGADYFITKPTSFVALKKELAFLFERL